MIKLNSRVLGAFATVALSSVWASPPQILDIGEPVLLSSVGQFRSSIATDSKDQPHIITTEGTSVRFYDKVGGTWRTDTMSAARFNSSQFGNPRLEIVNDNAWYSGVLWVPSVGIGIIYRENMATSPTPVASSRGMRSRPSPGNWDAGNMSVDPAFPLTAISSSMAGYYLPITYTGSGFSVGSRGQLFAGQGGEKNVFWISKSGSVPHPDGSVRAVWHGATGGYPLYPSAYRNSLMSRDVAWAVSAAYPAMGDDGAYVNVMSDNVRPEVGYMVATYAGVVMNIWDGQRMLFPTTRLLTIDPAGNPTARRYAPRLAAAKDGGVFVLWTRGGLLFLRHVADDGTMGDVINLGAGAPGDITVDSKGNLHIVYLHSGTRYRLVTVAGSTTAVTKAVDFNGDGLDELTTYNSRTRRWNIQRQNGQVLLNNVVFSDPNRPVDPVVGNFYHADRGTIGYYIPQTSEWVLRMQYNQEQLQVFQHGTPDSIPVVGDYNGNGMDDLALYNPKNHTWSVRDRATGTDILVNQSWGFAGAKPVPGDYNGDGKHDLAVYDELTGTWYIALLGGGQHVVQWGFRGGVPVARDFSGDGATDLGIYDPATQRWYVRSLTSAVPIYWGRQFGEKGAVPAPVRSTVSPTVSLATFLASSGSWRILPPAMEAGSLQTGADPISPGVPVPGYYFDPSIENMAIYEGSTGAWRIQDDLGNTRVFQWGFPGAIPVPGDYTGNGRTDLAVYHAGRWYIQPLGTASFVHNWGFPGAVPVPGDYLGDSRHDLAVYEASTGNWWIQSLDGSGGAFRNWGFPGAAPLSGDYSGNGKADLIVYSNGRWYIQSLTGAILENGANWGFPGTVPRLVAPGSLAVYHPESGVWYKRPDSAGVLWGLPDATPFVFNGKEAILTQDRFWYVRDPAVSGPDVRRVNANMINGTPIGGAGR